MLSIIKPIMIRFLEVSVILYLVLCSSCTQPYQAPLPDSTVQVKEDQANAELLFMKGDFENALLEFERIYETSPAAEERNKALYGVACTQMMLARTSEELAKAIITLQKWDVEKGSSPFSENRLLLVFALKQQCDYLEKKNGEQIELEKKKNTLIASQRQKLLKMTETIEKLQKQLEELEAIDEKFQEKRKTL